MIVVDVEQRLFRVGGIAVDVVGRNEIVRVFGVEREPFGQLPAVEQIRFKVQQILDAQTPAEKPFVSGFYNDEVLEVTRDYYDALQAINLVKAG